jgi:hypothetical protein
LSPRPLRWATYCSRLLSANTVVLAFVSYVLVLPYIWRKVCAWWCSVNSSSIIPVRTGGHAGICEGFTVAGPDLGKCPHMTWSLYQQADGVVKQGVQCSTAHESAPNPNPNRRMEEDLPQAESAFSLAHESVAEKKAKARLKMRMDYRKALEKAARMAAVETAKADKGMVRSVRCCCKRARLLTRDPVCDIRL